MPKISKQQVILVAGYAAFFTACFVFFAYLTFPYERVRDVLVRRVSTAGSPGVPATKLSIGELSPHWLTGVALEEVTYERAGALPGDPPAMLSFDELTVRASLFSLLGTPKVSFSAEVGDGELDGTYQGSEGGPIHVQAELEDLDLGALGLGSLVGIPMNGRASGELDVTLAKTPAETQGTVDLRAEHFELGDGKSKVKVPGMAGGLTLDTVRAGMLEIKLAIREGVATVEKLEAKGKDLELSGSGSVRVMQPFSSSRADLTLGAKFADSYVQKSDRTKAAFELMSLNPLTKRATGSDGTMRFRLSGPLGALRSAPAAPGRSASKSRRARSAEPAE